MAEKFKNAWPLLETHMHLSFFKKDLRKASERKQYVNFNLPINSSEHLCEIFEIKDNHSHLGIHIS